MQEEYDVVYSLYELIETLENIKTKGSGDLNFPKAFYCICKEIEKINFYIGCLHSIIPMNVKKFNPKPDESPFFSFQNKFNMSRERPTSYDYEEAKKRMAAFLNQSKQATSEES